MPRTKSNLTRHGITLSDGRWGNERDIRPAGVYLHIQSVIEKDRDTELRFSVYGPDGEQLVPITGISFVHLAKHLHIGPEDLTICEWRRVYGEDWKYHYRSPQKATKKITDYMAAAERDDDQLDLPRKAVLYALSLLEGLGYVDAVALIRTIVKVGLGFENKNWYHER